MPKEISRGLERLGVLEHYPEAESARHLTTVARGLVRSTRTSFGEARPLREDARDCLIRAATELEGVAAKVKTYDDYTADEILKIASNRRKMAIDAMRNAQAAAEDGAARSHS